MAMNWTAFKVQDDGANISSDKFDIETTHRVKYKFADSTLFLLSFDTIPFEVRFFPKNVEAEIVTVELRAEPNPYFDPEWMNEPYGAIPTPLTQNQAKAFKSFSNFRMLDQPIPDFELPYARGGICTPEDFLGKITVLNFWYASCLPCVAEIPALNALKEQYSGDDRVQFISFFADSITVDSNNQLTFARPRGFTKDGTPKPKHFDFNFDHVMLTKEVHAEFNVYSYPVNLVIDQQGVIHDINLGAAVDGDNEMLVRSIGSAIERLKNRTRTEIQIQ